MIAKVHALGRSFAGVAAYCLHDAPERNEGERPETAERVEWADTRNLASRPERAAAQMAATAKAAPELKRLAGVSAAGRKLEKPVLHYTLSWGKDERPDRAEMNRAAEETLKALGLKRHQALIVAHRDKDHPHLHMIANRVNPETGKAAKLGNDRLKLSRWAERWERERGQVKCPERAKNNAERAKGGQFVRDRKSLHTARHRRERMRKAGPVREVGPRVWLHKPAHLEKWATMEREAFRQYQQARGPVLEALARDCRQAWRWQYEEQKADVAAVEKLAGGDVRDRLRLARIAGDGDWRRIRQERDRPRRGGFGRKLRGAWKEARALGLRAAVGAVRSDPAELKRLAMAKLERGHWRARARIGQHHTYKAVAAETRGGSCVRPGGRGGAPGRPRYAGRGAAGARSRPAATASTDARSRPEPRPRRRLRALTFPRPLTPPELAIGR